MKRSRLILASGVLLMLFALRAEVKEGQAIPDLQFQADDGTKVSLREQKGKWLVLYFYPKDDTPGCTTEAKTFSSLLNEYKAANAVVYGINTDSKESHQAFKAKHGLSVTLLTDAEEKASKAFGIRVLFGLCARDSVLINPNGIVEKVYRGVNPAGSPKEILNYIRSR